MKSYVKRPSNKKNFERVMLIRLNNYVKTEKKNVYVDIYIYKLGYQNYF